MSFDTKPLTDNVGVEVIGLNLDQPLTDAVKQDLYDLWLQAGIVLFRGMGTSPERQLELSRCFGQHEVHPIEDIRVDGYPELIWLANRGKRTAGVYYFDDVPLVSKIPWHTDMIYTTKPGRGALLRMLTMPAQGGETGWVDTAAAYDALPAATQQKLEGLEALFQFILEPNEMRFGRWDNVRKESQGDIVFPEFPDVAHPLVWTHPESGRKALNLSPLHLRKILDMDAQEGDALLTELVEHTLNPRFRYVHHWKVNDMMLWDNWRTMHSTSGHPPKTDRLVHRTTLAGDHEFGRLL
jgi:alpha-ketoglutarate-dependent taurine dioxygenase